MDGSNTGFREKSFDLIIASDVLEHIEDDYSAVKEWNRILKPNGYVICFVPAFRFLWSKHDEDNKHYRRYTIFDLNEVFKSNNFAIIKSSYWNFVLFVPVFCLRLCLRLPFFPSKKYQLHETKEFWNKIFTKICRQIQGQRNLQKILDNLQKSIPKFSSTDSLILPDKSLKTLRTFYTHVLYKKSSDAWFQKFSKKNRTPFHTRN